MTVDRTPYCHKIRYGVTGAPEIPVDVYNAPDITLAPTLVEIRYLAPRGEQPASVDAEVRGYWMRGGERVQPEKETLHQFKNGPDGWPEWLAEEARLHDPAAVSSPPPDQTALRDRVAAAIWERQNPGRRWVDCEYRWRADAEADADAVLAVLPPAADRAAVLLEAAEVSARFVSDCQTCAVELEVATELRRLAAEAQQEAPGPGADLIEDYVRFLRGQGPEPDLSHLAPKQRDAVAGQFEVVRALADRNPNLPPLDRDPVARRLGLHAADAEAQQPERSDVGAEFVRQIDSAQDDISRAHAEGEHAFCGDECDDTDLAETDIDRMMGAGVPVQIVTAPPATHGAEARQPDTEARVVAYRSPGTRTLYCVICARQEAGWQPVTDADDRAVCDFCGGRVHAVAAQTLGEVVARYLPDAAPAVPVQPAADGSGEAAGA